MKNVSKKAKIHVLGSLKRFISHETSGSALTVTFELQPAVKDLIEAEGIPHTAIFKIEANGQRSDLSYNVNEGDSIRIYPFELVDTSNLDPVFVSPSSFITDVHLGKLTKTLRLLGIDTTSNQKWDDNDIIQHSNREHRMMLTRDRGLLKRNDARFGYWVQSTDPDRQVEEIFNRFALKEKLQPFTRCMECNGKLQTVSLEEVADRVPPKVKEWQEEFYLCTGCEKVYWEGSHFEKLKEKVDYLADKYS